MPLYEYRCKKCGHFEQIASVQNSEGPKPCPKCNKPAERVLSIPSPPQFKGSGFYATDYKKKK
jgi:putative FmdB family regulatory protein